VFASWASHLKKARPCFRLRPSRCPPQTNALAIWIIALAFLVSLLAPAHFCPPTNASVQKNTEAAALESALQTGTVLCQHDGSAAPDSTHKGQNSCDGHCCCQIVHAFSLPPPGFEDKTTALPSGGARAPPVTAALYKTLAALAAQPRGPPSLI